MKRFNYYPIYFLVPSKINGVVASFGRSHVVIHPEKINVVCGLLVTVNKAANQQKSEFLGVRRFTAEGAVRNR